jgi:RNA polymerase sigma factor for flagellar operon FliA
MFWILDSLRPADKQEIMSALKAPVPGIAGAEERDQLILEHLPQVRWIARRIHQSIQGRVDEDDLISAGTIGLIAAIDRFDPARQLQLKTYAEHKIRGAMMDHLRSLDVLSREDRRRTKEAGAAREGLEQVLQRAATHEEVAQEMGLSLKEYTETLIAPGAQAPFSLDAAVKGSDGELKFSELMPDCSTPTPEERLADSELRSCVCDAIDQLKPRSRSVITLHYAHGLTMRKIASMLEMSEWQVQESRRKAIGELRSRLAPLAGQMKTGEVVERVH